MGTVAIGKAIEQALMPYVVVAAAIAGLLVEDRLHFRRQREDVPSLRV